jgi:hypothetical protein
MRSPSSNGGNAILFDLRRQIQAHENYRVFAAADGQIDGQRPRIQKFPSPSCKFPSFSATKQADMHYGQLPISIPT